MRPGDLATIGLCKGPVPRGSLAPTAVLWFEPGPEDDDCKIPGDGTLIHHGTTVLVIAGPVDTPNLKKPGHHREWLVLHSASQRFGWVGDRELRVVE
jgi:hypothetical protein